MKINMKRTIYTAGLSAAVAAAALGLGGCGTGTQIPDTIKVQNMDADSNTITVRWWKICRSRLHYSR